jgi:tetratricopeptide (TPR) repeat protein
MPIVLLIGAGALVYTNSFNGQFVFDDMEVVEDVSIRTLWPPWEAMFSAGNVARPLVGLSLAISYAMSGLEVWSYHLFNVCVHVLASLALYGVVRRTLETPRLSERFGSSSMGLALAVSLLWVVHPLQTESVTYIVQRAEAMVGLFYLLTLYCVIRGTNSSNPWRWYGAAIACSAAGMATKPVMATAPLVILAWDVIFSSDSLREVMKRRAALYAGLAMTWVIVVVTVRAAAPTMESAGFGLEQVGAWSYFVSQPGAIVHYLKLAVWPYGLCLDYNIRPPKGIAGAIPFVIAVLALGVATLVALRRKPEIGFLGLAFFLILAPTSSFMPLLDLMVEHRMYLPLAAVIAFAVTGLYRLHAMLTARGKTIPNWLLPAALAVVAVWLGSLTIERNTAYQSKLVMWADVARTAPWNPRAHSNLGLYLYEQGEVETAIAHFEEALRLSPRMPDAHTNLGMALANSGRPEQAIPHFNEALAERPTMRKANFNLGQANASLGNWEEAEAAYRRELLVTPGVLEIYRMLGLSLEKQNKFGDAAENYQQALALWPNSVEMHCKLALAMSDSRAGSERDLDRAVQIGDRVVQMTGRRQPAVLDVVASVYSSAGRFKEAIAMSEEALAQARDAGDQRLTELISKRLDGYRANRPARP